MGSRHYMVDGTAEFNRRCDEAQADQELAEQRHGIHSVLDMAGDGHTMAEAAAALDEAMEWFNTNKKTFILDWFANYWAAAGHDPADILSPMDGRLRSGWEVVVIEARAAAILRGGV